MEEITVNRLNGVPFWGHGTMENLENDITPTSAEPQEEVVPEVEEVVEESSEPVEAEPQ